MHRIDENDPGINWMASKALEEHLLSSIEYNSLLGAREQIHNAINVAACVSRVGTLDGTYVLKITPGSSLGDIASAANSLVNLTGKPVTFRFQETVWRIEKHD